MPSNIKSLAQGTIIYGFANVSIKLIGIILIPIYTNYDYLSKSDFGVLGIIDITFQVTVIIFGLSLAQSLARWYFDPEHNHAQKSMFFTVTMINVIICVVSFALIFIFSAHISQLLFKTSQYSKLIWIMFAGSSVNIISGTSMMLLRLQEKAIRYSTVSISKLFITLLLTILFVVSFHKSVLGVYQAILIGEVSGFLMLLPFILKNAEIKFEYARLVQMLKYGLPLMLASVSTVLLNTFDRYTLNYLTNLDVVGTYTLGFRIANTIKVVVITSIQLSLIPILFKKIGDPDHKSFIAKSMNYSAFLVMLIIVFLSEFSLEIVKVLASNRSYWEAANIIPILSFAMIFVIMKENVLIGLQITKSSTTMGVLIAITALFNLGLNVLLIPVFGIYGASVSTLVSQMLMFILFYYVAQKHFAVPYEMRNLLKLIFTGIALFLVSLVSKDWTLVYRLVFKTFLILLFPIILIIFRFFESYELDYMKSVVMKYKRKIFK